MSDNILTGDKLNEYHQALKSTVLDPIRQEIDDFKSGDAFITELKNINDKVSKFTDVFNGNLKAVGESVDEVDIDLQDFKSSFKLVNNNDEDDRGRKGYTILPNGLKIQWGVVAFNPGERDKQTSYCIPFTEYCYSHVASMRGADNQWEISCNSYPMTANMFRTVLSASPASWTAVFYIAIGV